MRQMKSGNHRSWDYPYRTRRKADVPTSPGTSRSGDGNANSPAEHEEPSTEMRQDETDDEA